MTYEDYLEKMRAIGRNKPELDSLLDEAAEDSCISLFEYEALLATFLDIWGGVEI